MNRRSGSPEQPTPVHDTGTDSSTAPEARALGPSGIDRLADLLPVMVALNDEQGNGVFLNARVHDYLGLEPGATTTSWREHIHPEDRETAGKVWRDGLRSGKAFRNSFRLWHAASGDYRWNQGETVPLRAPNGGLLRWLSVLTDVHDRRLAELETQQQAARQQILARQQSALAKLGLHALEDYALPALMAQASRVVADLLDVEFCKILRLLPSGDELLLEAGVGWRKGLIGTTTISAGEGSQAGYAIECDGPVLEQDLRTETRFTSSPLLLDHDVISGISVVIRTPAGPYGVLGAHSRQRREFGEQEAAFLQGVANILGEAVERDRREDALRKSEDRFRRVFENAAVGIALLAPDNSLIEVNQRLCELLGYSRDELLSLPANAFGHPDDREATAETTRGLLTGEADTAQMEKRYVRKDGEVLWTDAAAAASRNAAGELEYMVVALQDITARKHAEEARQEALEQEARARRDAEAANARLRFLADAGHLLADSLDYQETLTRLANLAVPRWADWCAVDILNEEGVLERLAVAHQDPDKVRWAEDLQRRYPPDPNTPSGPYEVMRAGKPELYPEISWELLERVAHDEEQLELLRQVGFSSAIVVPLVSRGRSLGVLTLVHAESGRRYDQTDLQFAVQLAERAGVAVDNALLYQAERSLNLELEERVARRTEELLNANAELEAFTYSTSHDLRTPLRGINGFSQALLEDYGEQLDDTGKHYLQRIQAGAVRMDELIDDLLDLSRITRANLQTDDVDLSRLATELTADLAEADPDRKAEVHIQPGLHARGDARLLRIALDNLLGNAWKFSQGRPDARITFESETQDGKTVYVVRDNGAGFEMDYVDKLFVPFQRLHSPSDFEGTGIGLATVERVIHKHGGQIWAEGKKGEGAAFYFTLPQG